MDPTEDSNCQIHYLASDLPEPLPKLDLIERRYAELTRRSSGGRAFQLSKSSKYILKCDRAGKRGLLKEAWTMRYLREMTSISLPTVYAILTAKTGHVILVMEYIPYPTLGEAWPTLEDAEKEDAVKQLAAYFTELRALPSPGFYGCWLPPEFGNLGKQPLVDFLFTPLESDYNFGGPFDTMEQLAKGLGDCLQTANVLEPTRSAFYAGIIPKILSTESRPVFTHADLQLRNMIRKEDGQIVMLDWELSGWYPECWEYCITAFAADHKTDWTTYIPKFLPEAPKEFCLFAILRCLWYGGAI